MHINIQIEAEINAVSDFGHSRNRAQFTILVSTGDDAIIAGPHRIGLARKQDPAELVAFNKWQKKKKRKCLQTANGVVIISGLFAPMYLLMYRMGSN